MESSRYIFILLLFGMIFIGIAFTRNCPPPTIEYRYMPRTLDHYIKDSAFEGDIYTKMFDGEDIWYKSIKGSKLK